jgi:hypothetical protein
LRKECGRRPHSFLKKLIPAHIFGEKARISTFGRQLTLPIGGRLPSVIGRTAIFWGASSAGGGNGSQEGCYAKNENFVFHKTLIISKKSDKTFSSLTFYKPAKRLPPGSKYPETLIKSRVFGEF